MGTTARSPRRGGLAALQRDEWLLRVRRFTRGAIVAAVGGVAVMAGYVAHAAPGHHVSSTSGSASSSSSSSQPNAASPASPAPSSGLAPPASPPQSSHQAPQVVSGSS